MKRGPFVAALGNQSLNPTARLPGDRWVKKEQVEQILLSDEDQYPFCAKVCEDFMVVKGDILCQKQGLSLKSMFFCPREDEDTPYGSHDEPSAAGEQIEPDPDEQYDFFVGR